MQAALRPDFWWRERPAARQTWQRQKVCQPRFTIRATLCSGANQTGAMRGVRRLGEIHAVQGTYSQDWLYYDTDWNWRIDKGRGQNHALARLSGSALVRHDRARHPGCASLRCRTLICRPSHKTLPKSPRARSRRSRANWQPGPDDYTEVPIDSEDFAATLLRLGDRTRGAFRRQPGFGQPTKTAC